MKASLTSGYLSRSGFTAISIRMDPDSDYAIRTSILPLAEYPLRQARQTPDLCFAEMASSWLHPFFYTLTARPIGWTSSVCPRPPEFYSLPSVSVLRNTPLVVAVLTRSNFRANLIARTVKRCHWIFTDNLFARTIEQCGWLGQSLQQERGPLLGLALHF